VTASTASLSYELNPHSSPDLLTSKLFYKHICGRAQGKAVAVSWCWTHRWVA